MIKNLLLGIWLTSACLSAATSNSSVTVFENGKGPHACYRIPALAVAKDGTVLSFIEGRKTMHDHAHNDLLVRRSSDNGKTWATHDLIRGNKDVLVNPSPVVLENGDILLFAEEFPDKFHARSGSHHALLNSGFGEGSQKSLVFRSRDHGATWSAPMDVSQIARGKGGVLLTAGSPAAGIQLKNGKHKGRILFPLYHTTWDKKRRYNYLSMLISDDNGATWKRGENAPNPKPLEQVKGKEGTCNEFHIGENAKGEVIINARGNRSGRYHSVSSDGGVTWTKLALIGPSRRNNNAMMSYFHKDGKVTLVQSFSSNKTSRSGGKIQVSKDGITWKPVFDVNGPSESFGYSALAQLNNGNIGLLYESFTKSQKSVRFIEIPASVLTK